MKKTKLKPEPHTHRCPWCKKIWQCKDANCHWLIYGDCPKCEGTYQTLENYGG